MSADDETSSQIASDVLPEAVEELAVPITLDSLEPWHRPRKQYVRENQWLVCFRRHLERLIAQGRLTPGVDGGNEYRYLCLPGTDYLDARLIGDACNQSQCTLNCTGYLAGGQSNPTRARAQIRHESLVKSGYISDHSHTQWHRIEEVAHSGSAAHQFLNSRAPFHAVNFDACGAMALLGAGHSRRLIDALYRILEVQLARSSDPWLLFVTTDVRSENFDPDTLRNLSAAIIENAQASERFSEEAVSTLSGEPRPIEEALQAATEDHGEKFVRLFSLGIAKWMLHLAGEKGWEMRTNTSFFYTTDMVSAARPTMPSLSFEFRPPPAGLEDRFNVTNANPDPAGAHQEQSVRAAEKVREMQDLDQKIAEDHDLKQALALRTMRLLQEAGYSSAALHELDPLSASS